MNITERMGRVLMVARSGTGEAHCFILTRKDRLEFEAVLRGLGDERLIDGGRRFMDVPVAVNACEMPDVRSALVSSHPGEPIRVTIL